MIGGREQSVGRVDVAGPGKLDLESPESRRHGERMRFRLAVDPAAGLVTEQILVGDPEADAESSCSKIGTGFWSKSRILTPSLAVAPAASRTVSSRS